MFGKLSTPEIEALINHQSLGRIACHADDKTYIVPVSYAYDGAYLYGHTYEGMKINMMRKNPNICFEVDNTKNLANWQSVVAWGVFEELPKGAEWDKAVKRLEERALPILHSETMQLTPEWPFPSDGEGVKGIIFRIHLTEKTGRFERSEDEYFFAT